MPNMNETIAQMEGQALYEMYVGELSVRHMTPADACAPVGQNHHSRFRPAQWNDLSPTRKAFWQELAQDFLKAAQ